jgi:nicotinate-nucleotide adenylyltransferase
LKIGLYFGSFNPVHNGHLIIANFFANNSELDQVWFVISPQNPFKNSASLLNENHRKHLIDLAIEGEKKLRTSNIEFKLPKPSYTSDTLSYLEEKYPADSFSIIMGSDSVRNIRKWKNGDVILNSYPIDIYLRPGFPVDPNTLSSSIKVMEAPMLDISSSLIRKMIKERKSIRFMVPDVVKEEIEVHQYYY